MINPRGSTGYGQAVVDGVNGDWGGKPFTDLMTGLDYAEQHYPFIDKTPRVRPRRQLRRLHGQLDPRPHRSLQVHRLARRHVQSPNPPSASTEEDWFNNWEFKGNPWDYYGKPDC